MVPQNAFWGTSFWERAFFFFTTPLRKILWEGYDSPTAAPPFGVVDNRIGAESREVIRPDYDEHTARVTPFVPLRRD